jgi:hypothetical protein
MTPSSTPADSLPTKNEYDPSYKKQCTLKDRRNPEEAGQIKKQTFKCKYDEKEERHRIPKKISNDTRGKDAKGIQGSLKKMPNSTKHTDTGYKENKRNHSAFSTITKGNMFILDPNVG